MDPTPRSATPLHAVDPPAPPSEALLAAVASMRPVRTRVPLRTALVLALGSSLWAAAVLHLLPLRADLPWLPRGPWLLLGLLWLAGYLAALAAALLPRRGQVLPEPSRALVAALIVCGGALLLMAMVPVEAAGHTRVALPLVEARAHGLACFAIAVAVGAVPGALGLLALRRLAPTGGAALGAAAGASSGALGGLGLHLICDIGGPGHLLAAHGGALVACTLVGAAIGALAFNRRAGR